MMILLLACATATPSVRGTIADLQALPATPEQAACLPLLAARIEHMHIPLDEHTDCSMSATGLPLCHAMRRSFTYLVYCEGGRGKSVIEARAGINVDDSLDLYDGKDGPPTPDVVDTGAP